MATVDVINLEKKKVGTIDLSDDVFGVKINYPLVHQVIKAQLAGRRQGTAKTKTKSEVRGGGRKPFRQKGTGNARQGSTRSPLNPGGGQSFGPVPRSYDQRTPKSMMKGALRSALSDRMKAQRILIVDEFNLESAKTKAFNAILKNKLELDRVLIVTETNTDLERSARNIPHVKVLRHEGVNVYDIVRYPWLMMSKTAAEAVNTRLSPNSTTETAAKTRSAKAPSKAKKGK